MWPETSCGETITMPDCPHDKAPVIRAILGAVMYADGTVTSGMHLRDAQGVMTYVALAEETIDWERLAWALGEARRLLAPASTEEARHG